MYEVDTLTEALRVAAKWAIDDAAYGRPTTVHILEAWDEEGEAQYRVAWPGQWNRKGNLRRILSVRS